MTSRAGSLSRREALWMGGLAGVAAVAGLPLTAGVGAEQERGPVTKPIPTTGERLAVIGLGTGSSFSRAAGDPGQHAALETTLRDFVTAGGMLIDTAPNYGEAEPVLGLLLASAGLRDRVFAATKVAGVAGRAAGLRQARESARRLQPRAIDLLQVHNLVDWRTQLPLLTELKAEGLARYVGVTTYRDEQYAELEEILGGARAPDFVQVDYSINNRGAEERIIPAAARRGAAVIANMPFGNGRLFQVVAGRGEPPWLADFGARTWAQFFLRWIVSHPDVNVAIPATANPDHVRDNVESGYGPLLTPAERAEMSRRFEAFSGV